jgi:TPP-dependent pyruvate/acetoin dehydrogenase alpha subunit
MSSRRDQIEAEIATEIEAAFAFARTSPQPSAHEAEGRLYA